MENNNIGYSKNMNTIRWYNPNKFNPLDSSLAYIVFLALFFALPFGFNYFVKFLMASGINDIYILSSISLIVSQFIILAVAFSFSKTLRVNPFNGGGFYSSKMKIPALMSVILIMGMMVVFSPLTQTFVDNVYSIGGSYSNYDIDGNPMVALLYLFVLTTIFPAVCEELLFRGVILKGLLPYGKTFAIVMSSLMFAMAHGSFSQLIYQFFVGLAIGTVVVMTKNIMIGMFMHFTNNFFASIYSIIPEISKEITIKAIYISTAVGIAIGLACFVVALIFFIKYGLNQYRKEFLKEKTETNIKSCLSFDKNFESATFLNYDEQIKFSNKEEKVYFYNNIKKDFIPMRKKINIIFPSILLAAGIIFAVLLIINDFVGII
jgi:membrane protease YdiL (CAAX protease family)